MLTENFYDLVDAELESLINKYQNDAHIKKHQHSKNHQKAYALLIWFLQFYGKTRNYLPYITEGDNDSSCDIVFDKIDTQGKKTFYVVQAKWNNKRNCHKEIDAKDIKYALNDFDTILRGDKFQVNEALASQLTELKQHFAENGEIKFIIFTLCQRNPKADENIQSFLKSHNHGELTQFEVIDINRIKRDYIDFEYKQIKPINPLEYPYNPKDSIISLTIERLNRAQGNYLKIDKPYDAYIFVVKPKTIYELFEKFGFSLFFRNVRNPLLQSDFNGEIEQTILDNPSAFWYYNNGITAITYIMPPIRKEATVIKLPGLQIINGAQTVYAIYSAYKHASSLQRAKIDDEALITLRLLRAVNKEFDLKVTRYTNSQNPMSNRDFYANDEIQEQLQNDFFNTTFWYERRRDEFRVIPDRILSVPNTVFANAYLAYHLQQPVRVIKNYNQSLETDNDLIFLSYKEHQDGMYEQIFNEKTTWQDMLCAYCLYRILLMERNTTVAKSFTTEIFHVLGWFKVVFTKYARYKYGSGVNLNKLIIKYHDNNEIDIIIKTFRFISNQLPPEFSHNLDKWESYDNPREFFEKTAIHGEDIEL
jgi:DNA-directed RNA polymerase subunit RPC12/RpoP